MFFLFFSPYFGPEARNLVCGRPTGSTIVVSRGGAGRSARKLSKTAAIHRRAAQQGPSFKLRGSPSLSLPNTPPFHEAHSERELAPPALHVAVRNTQIPADAVPAVGRVPITSCAGDRKRKRGLMATCRRVQLEVKKRRVVMKPDRKKTYNMRSRKLCSDILLPDLFGAPTISELVVDQISVSIALQAYRSDKRLLQDH